MENPNQYAVYKISILLFMVVTPFFAAVGKTRRGYVLKTVTNSNPVPIPPTRRDSDPNLPKEGGYYLGGVSGGGLVGHQHVQPATRSLLIIQHHHFHRRHHDVISVHVCSVRFCDHVTCQTCQSPSCQSTVSGVWLGYDF